MTTGFASRPNRMRQRRNPSVAGVGAAAEKPDTTKDSSVEDATGIDADENVDTDGDGAEDTTEDVQADTGTADTGQDSDTPDATDSTDATGPADDAETEPEDTSEPQDEPEPTPAKPAKAKTARKPTKSTAKAASADTRALVVIGEDGSVRADGAAHVLDLRELDADTGADELLDALKALSATADSEVRDGVAGLLSDMIRSAALNG